MITTFFTYLGVIAYILIALHNFFVEGPRARIRALLFGRGRKYAHTLPNLYYGTMLRRIFTAVLWPLATAFGIAFVVLVVIPHAFREQRRARKVAA